MNKNNKNTRKSLAETHPHIAKLWHPTKNIGLKNKKNKDISTPDSVTSGSGKEVWWVCKYGHEWQSAIFHIVRAKEPCPYCAGRLPIPNVTDLATTHPQLALEWDYDGNLGLIDGDGRDVSTPDKITAGSNITPLWKCSTCGHIWKDAVCNRTRGSKCPECLKNKRPPQGEDLQTLYPKLAEDWDYEGNRGLKNKRGENISTPDKVMAFSNYKVSWKCKTCNHTWPAVVADRTRGCGCPYCAGTLPIPHVTDLMTTHPKLASEWNYEANNRLVDCSGRDISSPDKVTAGSGYKVSWMCKTCGHTWKAIIKNRTRGVGCPECAKAKYAVDSETLLTLRPDIAEEWDYERNKGLIDGLGRDISTPDKVLLNSHQKVWWQCKICEHKWRSTIESRHYGTGCPECAKIRSIVDGQDLESTNPELAGEWDYEANNSLVDGNGRDISTPDKISPHSKQKVSWKCKACAHKWKAVVADRTKGHGCPVCAGKVVVHGKDLSSTHPELSSQWHPTKNGNLKPTDVSAGSDKKVWWQCPDCGHEWQAVIHNRSNGYGCPKCRESKGEKAIRKVLDDLHIAYIPQYDKFKDRFYKNPSHPLIDDFAILDENSKVIGTIEYHGGQHYFPVDFAGRGSKWAQQEFENIQKRDKVKSDYLSANNIPQLIVPYWDFNNILTIVSAFLETLPLSPPVLPVSA